MPERATLTAEIHGELPDAKLHIEVTDGETTIDEIEANLSLLTSNNQYLSAFERPVLSLLTLYERQAQEPEPNGEIDDSGTIDPDDLKELNT